MHPSLHQPRHQPRFGTKAQVHAAKPKAKPPAKPVDKNKNMPALCMHVRQGTSCRYGEKCILRHYSDPPSKGGLEAIVKGSAPPRGAAESSGGESRPVAAASTPPRSASKQLGYPRRPRGRPRMGAASSCPRPDRLLEGFAGASLMSALAPARLSLRALRAPSQLEQGHVFLHGP